MDWWVVKQLRAMVLTDLRDLIPQGYFESESEKFKLHERIKNSDHFSREIRWGYLAGVLGRRLLFESTAIMSARQVSASEVLMNLGMLAGAEGAHGASTNLSKAAEEMGVSDGNAGAVAKQLGDQHIPTLSNNVRGSLHQYLRYLTLLEAEPFLPLLESVPDISSRSVPMKSPRQPSGQSTIIFNGPVGAVQTGADATANVQQWVQGDSAALSEALQQLRTSIRGTPELDPKDKDGIVAEIEMAEAELKATNPSKSRLLKWLTGIAMMVQTIGSAQPALDAVRAAAKAVGLPF